MKLKIYILLIIGCCLFATACLKDDNFDNESEQSAHNNGDAPKIVEIKLTATDPSNFFNLAFYSSDKDTVIDLVPINLATNDAASEDIHVTVSLDSNLVHGYNDANGTAYVIPSSSIYTIDPVVTIPKGKHTGYLQIKLKPSDFLGVIGALGFKITAIQEPGYTISGNFNTGVTAIIVKNEYDGLYDATGHFDHPTLGGDYSSQWVLQTTGIKSVSFTLNVTVPFSVVVTLTINDDNSVTVTSDDVALDPYDASKNYYTPADKTFHLDFGYSGGTRHLTGTATFAGPR